MVWNVGSGWSGNGERVVWKWGAGSLEWGAGGLDNEEGLVW
jgi:hypothetical protein